MPDDKYITMYSQTPGKAPIQVPASRYKEAVAQGWGMNPPTPKADAGPSPGDAHASGMSYSGKMPADPLHDTTFMQAFSKGINPLHTPPEGLPKDPGLGGTSRAMAADMLNLREMAGMRHHGNIAGEAGMMAGTGLSMAGPEIIKGMVGGSRAIKGLKGAAMAADAAERAADLQKELKGPIKAARAAADFTQPIIDSLSKQYAKLHGVLDKEVLPHSARIVQIANKMEMAKEPAIAKLGEDLLTKTRKLGGGTATTLLEFGQAHGLHRQVQRMMARLDTYKIGQWAGDLKELDQILEAGKSAVATSKGIGPEWERLGDLWKSTNDLAKAIVQRMSTGSGFIDKTAERLGLKGLPAGAVGAGKELAGKAGVKSSELVRPGVSGAKVGATAMQGLPPIYRAIMSMLTQGGGTRPM